jgi:hypothetical protein
LREDLLLTKTFRVFGVFRGSKAWFHPHKSFCPLNIRKDAKIQRTQTPFVYLAYFVGQHLCSLRYLLSGFLYDPTEGNEGNQCLDVIRRRLEFWPCEKWKDKSFCPLNTRLRIASARQARKDAKIQRTIAVNSNSFVYLACFVG